MCNSWARGRYRQTVVTQKVPPWVAVLYSKFDKSSCETLSHSWHWL
uniref:Uncharacterized protein n=1 Tax=Anguilla anguilla TaxID=7936 RepID=A0A0E9RWZ0_ANGAN